MTGSWRIHFGALFRYSLFVTLAVLAASLLQLVMQPRIHSNLRDAGEMLVLALGGAALLVLPAMFLVGVVSSAAMRGAERARVPRGVSQFGGAVIAGALAFGFLAAGLWWAVSGFGWFALVGSAAIGAPWMLAARPASRPGV